MKKITLITTILLLNVWISYSQIEVFTIDERPEVARDVIETNEEILKAKEDIGTINTDIGTIKDKQKATDNKITAIETDMSKAKEDIGTINTDIGTIKDEQIITNNKITAVETDLTQAKADIVRFDDMFIQHNTRVDAEASRIDNLLVRIIDFDDWRNNNTFGGSGETLWEKTETGVIFNKIPTDDDENETDVPASEAVLALNSYNTADKTVLSFIGVTAGSSNENDETNTGESADNEESTDTAPTANSFDFRFIQDELGFYDNQTQQFKWRTSAGNLVFNEQSGNAGFGTSNSTAKLSVKGKDEIFSMEDGNGAKYVFKTQEGYFGLFDVTGERFLWKNSQTDGLTFGDLSLERSGDNTWFKLDAAAGRTDEEETTTMGAGIKFDNGENTFGQIFQKEQSLNIEAMEESELKIRTNGEDRFVINSVGNIRIGPEYPGDSGDGNGDNGGNGNGDDQTAYKMSVSGKMITGEIKVVETLEGLWPDYVFEKGYKLMSLKETEQYIKKEKHLPEIPSADEVNKSGIELAKMNAKLLKKIEELTIHMIEMDKKMTETNKRIEKLEKENEELKNE
jgi:hypothetical protein